MTAERIELELVTYGCGDMFKPSLWTPPDNTRGGNKPCGGLWASPVNSTHSWRRWCATSDNRPWSKNFDSVFWTRFTGNAFVIHSPYDISYLPWFERQKPECIPVWCIDFEKLIDDGIDAVYLTENGEHTTRHESPGFWGWSCESIVILNSDCIEVTGSPCISLCR